MYLKLIKIGAYIHIVWITEFFIKNNNYYSVNLIKFKIYHAGKELHWTVKEKHEHAKNILKYDSPNS